MKNKKREKKECVESVPCDYHVLQWNKCSPEGEYPWWEEIWNLNVVVNLVLEEFKIKVKLVVTPTSKKDWRRIKTQIIYENRMYIWSVLGHEKVYEKHMLLNPWKIYYRRIKAVQFSGTNLSKRCLAFRVIRKPCMSARRLCTPLRGRALSQQSDSSLARTLK